MALILNDLRRKRKKGDIQNLWREGITLKKEEKPTPPQPRKVDLRKDGNKSAAYHKEAKHTLPESRKVDVYQDWFA